MEIALEARHLVKQYPGVLAVDDVSFEVRAGSCFGLLGPNGAGKTTTVEIMEGVTPATSGEVYYVGRRAGNKFREEAGIQFQNTALQDYLTVRESLQMFQSLYNRHSGQSQAVRRAAPAPVSCRCPGQQATARVSGRTHHGTGPAGTEKLLGPRQPDSVRRHDYHSDHALHG
jgi:ABC-type branched-subunit amino acid transport system ATPase component